MEAIIADEKDDKDFKKRVEESKRRIESYVTDTDKLMGKRHKSDVVDSDLSNNTATDTTSASLPAVPPDSPSVESSSS